MTRLVVAFAALAALGAGSASAAEPQRNYVTLRAGYSALRSGFVDQAPGGDLELAAGRWFRPEVAGEIALGWYSTEGHRIQAPPLPPGSWRHEMEFVPVTATVKLRIPWKYVWPYVLGGAGVYWTEWKRTDPPVESDTSVFVAGHLGCGLAVSLSGRGILAFDLRYVLGSVHVFGQKERADAVRPSVALGLAF